MKIQVCKMADATMEVKVTFLEKQLNNMLENGKLAEMLCQEVIKNLDWKLKADLEYAIHANAFEIAKQIGVNVMMEGIKRMAENR